MFTPDQYRAKAAEYAGLARMADSADALREFQMLERSFTVLADNAQWVSDHREQTVDVEQRA